MRTAGKLVRLLGSAIIAAYEEAETDVCLKGVVINKQLKTDDENGSGAFTFEVSKGKKGHKSVAFELSGRELRELFTKSDESVVINFVAAAFPNDAVKRESWTTLFCAYREIIIEISKGEYAKDAGRAKTTELYWTTEKIWGIQDMIDEFGDLYLQKFDLSDVMPYFHMLIGGHITELMHMYGSWAKYQQQAWERVMGEVKCVILISNPTYSCKSPTPDEFEAIMQIHLFPRFYETFVSQNPFHHLLQSHNSRKHSSHNTISSAPKLILKAQAPA